jgi:hypothetical protein
MTNAERILRSLDKRLTRTVALTIYGRAALALGFDPRPKDSGKSMDVDAILPLAELREIEQNEEFWNALKETNEELEENGLYITHLFQEDQVVLSEGWMERRVKIDVPGLKHLEIYRPNTIDLVLTKMTRPGDPEDLEDIKFMLERGKITTDKLRQAFRTAKVPPIPEIEEAFKGRQKEVLEAAEAIRKKMGGGNGDR